MLINKETNTIYLTGELSTKRREEVDEACDFIEYNVNTVRLIINSGGGNTDLAIQLINSIKLAKLQTSFEILAIVSGRAFSSAAIIALSCDSMRLRPGASLMFHGTKLSFNNSEDTVDNFTSFTRNVKNRDVYLDKLCQPFLTKEEVDKQNNGHEIYVNWNDDDLDSRIKRHFI